MKKLTFLLILTFIFFTSSGVAAADETDKYEAEDADVNRVDVLSSSYASNGQYVGQINFEESYVEFNVNAPESGNYKMDIGYANGTGEDSTHNLIVNDETALTVMYPTTEGWSNVSEESIQTVSHGVPLKAGDNTIRLSKARGFAELDYITLTQSSETTKVEAIDIITEGNRTEMAPNNELKFSAIVSPSEATDASVSWTVRKEDGSKTSAAKMNDNGVLSALKEETVKVTAISNDNSDIQDSTLISIKGNQLTIDLADPYRSVTHSASGSLYGLAEENRPTDSLIGPTKPSMFTQMAPDGGQLPNGEDSPTGDALEVASIAKKHGAKVTVRMPDKYPDFPYQWVNWEDWNNKVEEIVEATKESEADNIYGYEIWNEPDMTWDAEEAGPFFEGWKNTFTKIRELDSNTNIIGPSITQYDEEWLKDFLTYCKDNNCLPDIISWHELGNPEGDHVDGPAPQAITNHVESYRQLEKDLNISPLPISINEYGVQTEEGVPGNMIQYISQFERTGVETANAAFWFRPGRLSNIITETEEPNGGWWLYKWYGDMSGEMVMTTPASNEIMGLDGISSIDSEAKVSKTVFGGAEGNSMITVKGLDSASFLSETIHVKVESAPWYGVDTPVQAPNTLFEGEFDVLNDQINIPVTGMNKTSGYNLTITPSDDNINRYEAENAHITSTQSFNETSSASNNQYAVIKNDDTIEFDVNVDEAGEYAMNIRYANGREIESKQKLLVNGKTRDISFPATHGWISENLTEIVNTTVHMDAGNNTITLDKDPTDRRLEIDYIQINPEREEHFKLRSEAEEATIQNANIYNSGYASNRKYVGSIDNKDSYVEFEVHVPDNGKYNMEVGYSNGQEETATQTLSINEVETNTITMPSTGGWMNAVPNMGTRNVITNNTVLNKGKNTIRFTQNIGYAELDYIKLTKQTSIDSLKNSVKEYRQKDWIKNDGIENSLQEKLNNGSLNSFVNQVTAQRGKHIAKKAADYLLQDTEYLLDKQ